MVGLIYHNIQKDEAAIKPDRPKGDTFRGFQVCDEDRAPQNFISSSNRGRETERGERKARGAPRAAGSAVCLVMICGVMNFHTLYIRGMTLRIAPTVSDSCNSETRAVYNLLPSTSYQLLRPALPT